MCAPGNRRGNLCRRRTCGGPGKHELQLCSRPQARLFMPRAAAPPPAALKCLMQFYGVGDAIPAAQRPGLVLAAEAELGITAGLQDRVIQARLRDMHGGAFPHPRTSLT